MDNRSKQSYTTSLLLVGCLYFIFGFVTWLNSTLIPFLKTVCQLNNQQSFYVASAFYASYFCMALPSSFILRKTGFKNGMSLGMLFVALGTIVFVPAANQRNFSYFLTGLFIQGLGLSIMQTAVNPYVTILGPEESAAKRISIMGICNKLAGILSPAILATILLRNIDSVNIQLEKTVEAIAKQTVLNEIAHRIIGPYITLAVISVIFAFLIKISPLPEVHEETANPDVDTNTSSRSIFNHTYLFLGAVAIFFYVGVEVLAGDSIIGYGKFQNISTDIARYFTSMTLTFMVVGYFLGVLLIPRIIKQETALVICCLLALCLSAAIILLPGLASVFCLAALGISNSLMWPAIWPMALKGLGKYTKIGSALLIMGIVGGAIIPPLYGKIGDHANLQFAYVILIPCYLYILFFAVKGHKIGYIKQPQKPTGIL